MLRDVLPSRVTEGNRQNARQVSLPPGSVLLAADDSFVARDQVEKVLPAIGAPYLMTVTGKDAWVKLQALAQEANAMNANVEDTQNMDRASVFEFDADIPGEALAALLQPGARVLEIGAGERPKSRKMRVEVSCDMVPSMSTAIFTYCHNEFRRRQMRGDIFDVNGETLRASSGVYHPEATSSTRYFWDNIVRAGVLSAGHGQQRALSVMDMGCGCGALSILWFRARSQDRVTGLDIDPVAIADARFNAARAFGSGTRSPQFHASDLFSALPPEHERFDVVLFNYPFWQQERYHVVELDRVGIDPNGVLLEQFIEQLPARMHAHGRAYLSYSTQADVHMLRQLCAHRGLALSIVNMECQDEGAYSRSIWEIRQTATGDTDG